MIVFEGMDGSEGEALLAELAVEIIRFSDAGAYVHQWKPTDMVIWDNLRLLHCVIGCTPPQRRVMPRTTIKGDYGLDRFENGDRGHYKELEHTV